MGEGGGGGYTLRVADLTVGGSGPAFELYNAENLFRREHRDPRVFSEYLHEDYLLRRLEVHLSVYHIRDSVYELFRRVRRIPRFNRYPKRLGLANRRGEALHGRGDLLHLRVHNSVDGQRSHDEAYSEGFRPDVVCKELQDSARVFDIGLDDPVVGG